MSGVQEIRGQKAEKNPSRQKSKATICQSHGNLQQVCYSLVLVADVRKRLQTKINF